MMHGKLPTIDLQWLQNVIDSATDGCSIKILRGWTKDFVDDATPEQVIRMAKCMLQCGVDAELAKRN